MLRGEVDEGLAQLEAQYKAMGDLGSKLVDPAIVSLLAEGYLTADRPELAATLLDRLMPAFEHDGRVSFVPDYLRLRAEAMLRVNPGAADEALALLDRAIAVAREHGAGSFELRSALTAARILRERGRVDEARALVADPTPASPRGSTTPTSARRAPTSPDPTQRNEGATMDWTPLAKALQATSSSRATPPTTSCGCRSTRASTRSPR